MKPLNNSITKRYAYAIDGVIYKIEDFNDGDACVHEINDSNVPYFDVSKNGETSHTYYYLDSYIEVGDKFDGTNFYKRVHSYDGGEEYYIDLFTAYRNDCEEQMADVIVNNYNSSYDDFTANTANKFGIKEFVLDGQPYTFSLRNIGDRAYLDSEYNLEMSAFTVDKAVEYGGSVQSIDGYKIKFTNTFYDNAKHDKVRELALNAAKQTANKYKYKVTDNAKQCFDVEMQA